MPWAPENTALPQWTTFRGDYSCYLRPSYNDKLREAADTIASAVYNAPKGSTFTVNKHSDGGVGLSPIVTITVTTVIE